MLSWNNSGNKYAEPSLWCSFSTWGYEKGGETPCLDSLRKKEIVLEHYTTAFLASDIHALRQALVYERWILYGTSYSTRLMQLVMADDPDGVRSVVLHATSPITDNRYRHEPENATRVLQVMFRDCSANPDCSKAYPDLESKFYALVRKLNHNPVELEVLGPQSFERISLEVDGYTLIDWMVEGGIYGAGLRPV